MTTTSVLPGLVDAHVHLGLVEYTALVGSPVVEVHDLGWLPGSAERWRQEIGSSVKVLAAGPFHAAPGGYPHGRSWAPEGSVREITDAESARHAVSAAVAADAHTLKVTLHTGGPRLEQDLLHTLVQAAHAADLTVSAHAEGAGQAADAAAAGADVLVHAPWTETLDEVTLRQMAGKSPGSAPSPFTRLRGGGSRWTTPAASSLSGANCDTARTWATVPPRSG